MLDELGFSARVELRHAPLAENPLGEPGRWYDLAAIEACPDAIDLIIVDGPPEDSGPDARFPAGPVLLPRLRPGGAMLLDDAAREQERRMSDRFRQLFPHVEQSYEPFEKGALILRVPDGSRG